MKLGIVARCDNGGLGAQTWEAVRHLQPDRVLVVHTAHRTRGTCDPARYDGPNVTYLERGPTRSDAKAFMLGLDVVFTCEAVYGPDWMPAARALGCQVVVQVNPEMYDAAELSGARIVLPTEWESQRVPHERVLPVPIATDRFTPRVRTEARTFYHVAAPAMLDRNGTGIVMAALRYVTAEITVIVRGALTRTDITRGKRVAVPKNVTLRQLSFTDRPYYEAWPDADVLLLPRRYGGLALPMQEAAAQGMPVLTSDLRPQNAYPHCALVPASAASRERMKGGDFEVYTVDPRVLAAEIDLLASSPARVEKLSARALEWAQGMSWSRWIEQYEATLGR